MGKLRFMGGWVVSRDGTGVMHHEAGKQLWL